MAEDKPSDKLTLEPPIQGSPVIETPSQGQPQPQAEAQITPTPEPVLPEKYKGKSPEEIIQIALNQDKIIGRLGREVGELRDMTQRVLQQSQTRTVGPDMMPQTYPSPQQGQDGKFVENLLSDQAEPFFRQNVKKEVVQTLLEFQQAQQNLAQLQYNRELKRIEEESTRQYHRLAEESGLPYEDVERLCNREFRNNRQMVERVYKTPHEVSSNEIEEGVRNLYKKALDEEDKREEERFKKRGWDPEVASQLTKARKEIAANSAPDSKGSTHGNSGVKVPKDMEDVYKRWKLLD